MTYTIEPVTFQGQFGEFTITDRDRREVIIYRSGLAIAALCFAIATGLTLGYGNSLPIQHLISVLYSGFCLALGVSLFTIHIYLKPLHQALQIFWGIGIAASVAIAHASPAPFALMVYQQPMAILGIGFVFAALTGIFFKEAVCFNRLEAKFLTLIVPTLLLGHLSDWMPVLVEQGLLATWAVLFLIFAIRKGIQAIPPDIGDKSVFVYLKEQRQK